MAWGYNFDYPSVSEKPLTPKEQALSTIALTTVQVFAIGVVVVNYIVSHRRLYWIDTRELCQFIAMKTTEASEIVQFVDDCMKSRTADYLLFFFAIPLLFFAVVFLFIAKSEVESLLTIDELNEKEGNSDD